MPRRLIGVDFPIREVSEVSAWEKNIRHGSICTLHIWWARRPLTVFPGCPFEPRCSFAMEVCRQGPPPLVRVGEEHYVACYRFVEGVSKSWS